MNKVIVEFTRSWDGRTDNTYWRPTLVLEFEARAESMLGDPMHRRLVYNGEAWLTTSEMISDRAINHAKTINENNICYKIMQIEDGAGISDFAVDDTEFAAMETI